VGAAGTGQNFNFDLDESGLMRRKTAQNLGGESSCPLPSPLSPPPPGAGSYYTLWFHDLVPLSEVRRGGGSGGACGLDVERRLRSLSVVGPLDTSMAAG